MKTTSKYLDTRSVDDTDYVRFSEHAHEQQLQKELKKYGIDFELSKIQPHGLRCWDRKTKNL